MCCSYDRVGRLGSRDLGFSNRDLSKRAGDFAIWTLQPGYPDESGMNSGGPDGVVLHCLLSFSHHKPSIPFNCSDTALGVAKVMVGVKVIIFVFCHVCFVRRISSGSLTFFHLGNRAEISHMNPKRNWSRQTSRPVQPGSCEEALSLSQKLLRRRLIS